MARILYAGLYGCLPVELYVYRIFHGERRAQNKEEWHLVARECPSVELG